MSWDAILKAAPAFKNPLEKRSRKEGKEVFNKIMSYCAKCGIKLSGDDWRYASDGFHCNECHYKTKDGRSNKCILCNGTGYFKDANGGTVKCRCKK
jgi:hypothetical protein